MAQILVDVGAAPGTPASGKSTIYAKTDKVWYSKDDAGNEVALGITLPVTVPNGGTNSTTLTNHGVLLGQGTSAIVAVAPAANYKPLLGTGTGADPAFNAMTLVSALTDGSTPALDASLVPWWVTGMFTLAAAGNRTIAVPSNPTNGQKIVIRHLASGGARTLALNTGAGGFRFGTDITTLTQTASGKTDYIGCIYSSIDSFWDVVAYTKGF